MGTLHDAWNKAKATLTPEQAKKLPKEDLGQYLDKFETLCKNLATELHAVASRLQEYNKEAAHLQSLVKHYKEADIPPPGNHLFSVSFGSMAHAIIEHAAQVSKAYDEAKLMPFGTHG